MTRKAFLLALAICALPLTAAPPMTAITVHVTNLAGKPVDHASVVVKFVSGHAKLKLGKSIMTSYELQTTQEGEAKIPPIPQGRIQIQVIAKNYQTFGDLYDISETEKTVEVKLNPPQSQYSVHE
jgi:Carboxypeptidase regulatory-like domain